jgi:hypothetical protein
MLVILHRMITYHANIVSSVPGFGYAFQEDTKSQKWPAIRARDTDKKEIRQPCARQ